eukprot:TRINITY_DN2202_c0_g1_i5.p1 TRINITY_DN2202_c0_g1~~TRINITY_DN2202_c0_g1_i5.p1  ORF type:complete len:707 (-),score=210.77 TRINITY_DN2202_c0_g1_i5:4-2124(-)
MEGTEYLLGRIVDLRKENEKIKKEFELRISELENTIKVQKIEIESASLDIKQPKTDDEFTQMQKDTVSSFFGKTRLPFRKKTKLFIKRWNKNGTRNFSELLKIRYDNGRTLLHEVAISGTKPDAAKFLVNKCRFPVDIKDLVGRTPLHYAAQHFNPMMAKMFLELGANLEAEDIGGKRAIDYAQTTNSHETVKLLLELMSNGSSSPKLEVSVSPVTDASQLPITPLPSRKGLPFGTPIPNKNISKNSSNAFIPMTPFNGDFTPMVLGKDTKLEVIENVPEFILERLTLLKNWGVYVSEEKLKSYDSRITMLSKDLEKVSKDSSSDEWSQAFDRSFGINFGENSLSVPNWCFEPEHFSRPEWQEQVTKAQNANDDNYNNSDKSNNADSTDDTIIAQDLTSVFENLKLDDGNEKMDQNENEHDDLADIDIGIKTQPLSDESSLKDIQAPHHHEESTVIPKLTEIEISIGSEKDNKTVAKYHPTPIIPRQIQINEAPQAYVGTPIVKRSSSKLPSTPSLSTLNKRLNDSIWFRELERLAGAFVTKLSGDVDSCMRVTNFFVLLCSPTSVMDLPRLMIRKLDYEMVEGNDPIKEHEYERFQFFAPDQSAPEILLKVGPFDDLENATKFLSNWKQSAREGTSTLDWKEVTNNKIEDDEENEGILEFKEGEDTETMVINFYSLFEPGLKTIFSQHTVHTTHRSQKRPIIQRV